MGNPAGELVFWFVSKQVCKAGFINNPTKSSIGSSNSGASHFSLKIGSGAKGIGGAGGGGWSKPKPGTRGGKIGFISFPKVKNSSIASDMSSAVSEALSGIGSCSTSNITYNL